MGKIPCAFRRVKNLGTFPHQPYTNINKNG